MSMYRGTRSFDREQLVFVVDTILTAAVDRIEACLPPTVPKDDYEKHKEDIHHWKNSAEEVAGMGLAILYAQLTDDGIGAGDVLDILSFREFIDDLVLERTANGAQVTPDGFCMPDCRQMAERFVDDLFQEYLEES